VPSLRRALFPGPRWSACERLIARLPPYQVAFWPDGWELGDDGTVTVRDTHAMAEARRWYRLARRSRPREGALRVMSVHGINVPRAIVEMAGRRFPSGDVASVAVELAAGDWVRQRRRQLAAQPEEAIRDRDIAWSGSRYASEVDAGRIAAILRHVMTLSVREGLVPDARYRLVVDAGDGYGVRCHRCRVEVCLDSYERRRVEEALRVALVPWNRALVRDGRSTPLIELQVKARRRASSLSDQEVPMFDVAGPTATEP
jgi:hypothetical protein